MQERDGEGEAAAAPVGRGVAGDLVVGVLGVHVDAPVTGAEAGSAYDKAIERLKAKFPFRKWREGSGEFTGTSYVQDMMIQWRGRS